MCAFSVPMRRKRISKKMFFILIIPPQCWLHFEELRPLTFGNQVLVELKKSLINVRNFKFRYIIFTKDNYF